MKVVLPFNDINDYNYNLEKELSKYKYEVKGYYGTQDNYLFFADNMYFHYLNGK